MDGKNKQIQKKGGRNPKVNPAIFRYSISLNAEENAQFLSLFEQSGMSIKAHFITACMFQRTIKTVKIDKTTVDFYMRLTGFYGQFRAVGVNYNQVVKVLNRNFSEKKAAAYLFKLEKQTAEMAALFRKVIQLIDEFERLHLTKPDKK